MTNSHKRYRKHARRLYRILIVICVFTLIVSISLFYYYDDNNMGDSNSDYHGISKDSISESVSGNVLGTTGFIDAPGMQETINNCTSCHSAQLVTQNRMTREGWLATIRWMQQTQNLWDLGKNEAVILDYLATHYAPEEKGRREPLKDIEWYTLNDQ